jgi:hypothetical protein
MLLSFSVVCVRPVFQPPRPDYTSLCLSFCLFFMLIQCKLYVFSWSLDPPPGLCGVAKPKLVYVVAGLLAGIGWIGKPPMGLCRVAKQL